MRKMTFEEFCKIPWTLSDLEYAACTSLHGEAVSSGYMHYSNIDESEEAVEEENRMQVSFPWHARRDNAGNVIVEADYSKRCLAAITFTLIN